MKKYTFEISTEWERQACDCCEPWEYTVYWSVESEQEFRYESDCYLYVLEANGYAVEDICTLEDGEVMSLIEGMDVEVEFIDLDEH